MAETDKSHDTAKRPARNVPASTRMALAEGAKIVPRLFAVAVALFLAFCLLPLSSAPAAMVTANAMPDKPGKTARLLQAVLKNLDGSRAEVVAIQRELVRRPALNPEHGGAGEEEKAAWIERWLLENNLPPAERVDSPDPRVPAHIRPNLIIRHPGAAKDSPTLWIVGHLDVSPAGAENLWTGSPWALRTDGDRLYGRGTADNNQCIATGLILLKALAKERAAPPCGLGLLFIAGGKSGYPREHGLARVLAARPELFRPGDRIVVNDYGDAQGSLIEIAEKGLLSLKITVLGKQAHAARPHLGVNAAYAGSELIRDLGQLYKDFPKIHSLFTPDVSTFTVTHVEAGSGIANQVPARFSFYLDCRLLSGYTPDAVERAVRGLADAAEKRDGVAVSMERVMAIPAASPTAPIAPAVLFLRQAIVEELKLAPQLAGNGAVTIAAELRERNLPVAVWQMADDLGNSVDEHVTAASHIQSARVFARMLFYENLTAVDLPRPGQIPPAE